MVLLASRRQLDARVALRPWASRRSCFDFLAPFQVVNQFVRHEYGKRNDELKKYPKVLQ
jgi:hypothetical protein